MINKQNIVNKKFKDIEFKMKREKDKCFIKIEPTARFSEPSTIYISLNNELHKWEVYDKDGAESCFVYFKSSSGKPIFYLKTGNVSYEITFNYEKITVKKIIKNHNIRKYTSEKLNFKSIDASCWGEAIFYSKRPDKPPFDEM